MVYRWSLCCQDTECWSTFTSERLYCLNFRTFCQRVFHSMKRVDFLRIQWYFFFANVCSRRASLACVACVAGRTKAKLWLEINELNVSERAKCVAPRRSYYSCVCGLRVCAWAVPTDVWCLVIIISRWSPSLNAMRFDNNNMRHNIKFYE